MASDIYDFGKTTEDNVTTDDVTTDDVVTDDVVTDDVVTDDVTTDDVVTDDITTTDDVVVSESEKVETEIDDETAKLDKELADLEAILKWDTATPWQSDEAKEVSVRLQETIKSMKSLTKKIDELELEKAERIKFWENAWLSPEMIILKAHYDKAKKWDEGSINKIKELIASDLGLEVTNQKKVFVSSAISSNAADVNVDKSEDIWFGAWFTM